MVWEHRPSVPLPVLVRFGVPDRGKKGWLLKMHQAPAASGERTCQAARLSAITCATWLPSIRPDRCGQRCIGIVPSADRHKMTRAVANKAHPDGLVRVKTGGSVCFFLVRIIGSIKSSIVAEQANCHSAGPTHHAYVEKASGPMRGSSQSTVAEPNTANRAGAVLRLLNRGRQRACCLPSPS